ncbi:unnamed protein product [Oikopleura dioica]|uniref:Transmembrane protein n=1 Tax=Oikopleura dioica TaxID=34765 RepID=E4XZR7_OIKDI|nr:unnamed protein product [Oikopleura dioica]
MLIERWFQDVDVKTESDSSTSQTNWIVISDDEEDLTEDKDDSEDEQENGNDDFEGYAVSTAQLIYIVIGLQFFMLIVLASMACGKKKKKTQQEMRYFRSQGPNRRERDDKRPNIYLIFNFQDMIVEVTDFRLALIIFVTFLIFYVMRAHFYHARRIPAQIPLTQARQLPTPESAQAFQPRLAVQAAPQIRSPAQDERSSQMQTACQSAPADQLQAQDSPAATLDQTRNQAKQRLAQPASRIPRLNSPYFYKTTSKQQTRLKRQEFFVEERI